jgi:hypothetical protein
MARAPVKHVNNTLRSRSGDLRYAAITRLGPKTGRMRVLYRESCVGSTLPYTTRRKRSVTEIRFGD